MTSARTFGRRGAPALMPIMRPTPVPAEPRPTEMAPATPSDPVAPPAMAAQARAQSVEEELDAWKEARKIRRRSFREPWRSVSVVTTIGLVGTGWMLPESVAWDAQIALGILTLGAFYAGWRRPR